MPPMVEEHLEHKAIGGNPAFAPSFNPDEGTLHSNFGIESVDPETIGEAPTTYLDKAQLLMQVKNIEVFLNNMADEMDIDLSNDTLMDTLTEKDRFQILNRWMPEFTDDMQNFLHTQKFYADPFEASSSIYSKQMDDLQQRRKANPNVTKAELEGLVETMKNASK